MSRLKGLNQSEYDQVIPRDTILLGYRGSIAHGMYIPQDNPDSIDDKDIMGIYIAPLANYFGLHKEEHREVKLREWDSVCYEIKKMFNLLIKNNPNVLSLLWLRENYYIFKDQYGQKIIDNRNIFVSKRAYHSFNGYAYSQLHRMTRFSTEGGYMGKKRKELVERHGHDTKNAAHLIRLLRMGIEFVTEGVLHVHRSDAENLLEIKRGEWTLDRVKTEADRLFKLSEEAYIRSKLPHSPNKEKAEKLLMDILREKFLE